MAAVVPLRMINLFQGFSEEHLVLLQKLFIVEKIDAKKTIYEEGNKVNNFYILYAGRVVITVKDELNMIVELTKLSNMGSLFGDEAFIPETLNYDATVTTLVETVVFRLPRKNIEKFLHISGDLGGEMRRAAYEKMSVKSISERIEAFKHLSKQKQHLMAALCQIVRFNVGEVISKQGKIPKFRAFYIVTSGTLDVILDDKVFRELKTGDYFGEIGLVTNRPHSATIKATSPTTCIVIEREDFKALFVDEPNVMAEFALKVYGENIEFSTFIKHIRGRKSFMKFCQSEYADENMEFILRVEKLEQISHRRMRKEVLEAMNIDISAMKRMKQSLVDDQCKKIIKTFVLDNCERQISMSAETKEKLQKRYERNDFSSDMFEEAKELVMSILESDNFARYKKSEQFKELLTSVGAYF